MVVSKVVPVPPQKPRTPEGSPYSAHIPALDGVRGLAILMVICSHAFESNSEDAGRLVRFVGRFLYYGFFGVDLFFVLSGFLITGILIDSLADPSYFRKFYARRILRIFPLYYGVLTALFALTPLLRLHWGSMGWLLVFYLQNLRPTTIATFSPGANIGLFHFWSLAVEEQFYLLWPAVVFFARGRSRLLSITLAASAGALLLRIILLFCGISGLLIHVSTLCRADTLLLGGALAILCRSRLSSRVIDLSSWVFLGSTIVVVGSIILRGPDSVLQSFPDQLWLSGIRYTVLAVGFASLIAWSLKSESLCQWAFERAWLRFLGKYSYGIYVLHVLVLGAMIPASRRLLLNLTHSRLLAVGGAGLAGMAVSIAAAYTAFHLFENKFLRLKRFFAYSRSSERMREGVMS